MIVFFFLDPISNLTVSGQNWLQHGDVLSLKVKCTGSPPYELCIHIMNESYNMTGNETCDNWSKIDTCEFSIIHYNSSTYKIIIIVKNLVAQVYKEITINIYEATKQSQLSVIFVPVSFCLVAVTLVVFGVAYYMQNRSR